MKVSWSIYHLHLILLASKELELYKEELVSKPALLVVNKMDLPDAEDKLAELKEQLHNPLGKVEFLEHFYLNFYPYIISIHSFSFFAPAGFSDLLPEDLIPKNCINFRHVVPVSASTGLGIDCLKRCIRESLDEDAEMANRAIHEERLQTLRNHVLTVSWWMSHPARKTESKLQINIVQVRKALEDMTHVVSSKMCMWLTE